MNSQSKKNNSESIRRMRPKKGFSKFLKRKVKTFNAHINEFEDDTASSTVVRWLVVVLLLHLVFIGGASLHGYLTANRNSVTAQVPDALAASPAAPQAPAPAQEPVAPAVNQVVPGNTAPGAAAVAVVAPQAQAPAVQQGNSMPKPGPVRHLVAAGDSWESIARDNGCTVLDLKTVNPGSMLTSGTTLIIPMNPADASIPFAEEVTGEESSEQVYVMQKGDTLSKVAKQHKVSVAKLQSYNNITDPRKIKIGQKLNIPPAN